MRLFNHHQIGEDQFRLHILKIAKWIDRPFFTAGTVSLSNKHQHVGGSVRRRKLAGKTGVAQSLLGDGREVECSTVA